MTAKGSLLASVSIVALAGAAFWLRRAQAPTPGTEPPPARSAASAPPASPDVAETTRQFLLYFVVPLWLSAGVADWACHRATDIEATTGPKESLLHLLMLAEVSVPVLAGLFLEITSPVLALMIVAFFLHEATSLWDVSYAVTRREVTPFEQHVHSFLEMVPLMAVAFIAVLHWPKLQALFGIGGAPADWSIRWKHRPLPRGYVVADLGATLVLEAVPYLEELWRTVRASRDRLVPAA